MLDGLLLFRIVRVIVRIEINRVGFAPPLIIDIDSAAARLLAAIGIDLGGLHYHIGSTLLSNLR